MPEFDDERNTHPVCGQTKATDKESVCGLTALLTAEDRTHRRVGYKNSVSRFHALKFSKCNKLKNELKNGTYKPERGVEHVVWEPKYRVTTSSKYRDRIPQASFVVNYFYPHVIPKLIDNNFACIKGRGVDKARETFKEILRRASIDDYCLKADFKGYFASIDHDVLYQEEGSYMPDEWAFGFFEQTCENTKEPVGLELGSEVYQLGATSLPNRMDHRLNNGNYLRYQDDMIFVGTKEECKQALAIIREEAKRLKLTIHEKKTFIQPVKRPIKFLGFSFLKKPSGKITMKRLPDKLRHERRKLRRMKDKDVPVERVKEHYISVRACLKKGSRSDLMKMDRFANKLFKGGLR